VSTPVKLQKEVPVRLAGDCSPWKHINEGMLSTGPQQAEYTTLRMEQLNSSGVTPYLQGMKTGRHPNWKDKYQSQCGVVVPFTVQSDVTWSASQKGSNLK
jgi:hypothetical protein